MGRDSRTWGMRISWTVSRHNSVNDRVDDLLEQALLEELGEFESRIEALCDSSTYKRLGPFVL